MNLTETIIVRLLIAAVIGGIIGAEREYRNKSAGFRTLILICMGSALFTNLSILIGEGSPDRIASNIVTGIGFLGGGVIFKSDNGVNGLTTAATIWITAALGVTIGGGYYWASVGGCVMVLAVLYMFTFLENWIEKVNQVRDYQIVCEYHPETLYRYEDLMKTHRLKFKSVKQKRFGTDISGSWTVSGHINHHKAFTDTILKDSTVKEFDF